MATKKAAKKAATKRAAPAAKKKAAAAAGPLTVAQARTMVQTAPEPAAKKARIDAQGTLPALPSSWHNEMHPSKGGFNQIADVFHAQIKALFPGRVVD